MNSFGPLADRYEIREQLGEGAFGSVYLGIQKSLSRKVALKFLVRVDQECQERFLRETKILTLVRHPAIVEIIECGTCDDLPFMVMEFVDGQRASAKMADGGALPLQRVIEISKELLDALQHIHETGLVHRDLKPDNILITDAGLPKIIDFGISLHQSWTRLTDTGHVVGSPIYMAPEQLLAEAIDNRTDLYSLGLIIYEMIYGTRLFAADNVPSLISKHLNAGPLRLPEYPTIPDQMRRLLQKLLVRQPAGRVPTAKAALELLAGTTGLVAISKPVAKGSSDQNGRRTERIGVEPVSPRSRSKARAVRRARLRALLLPVSAIAVLAVLGVCFVVQSRHRGGPYRMQALLDPVFRTLTVSTGAPVGTATTLELSAPDGSRIATVATRADGKAIVYHVPKVPQLLIKVLDRNGTEIASGSQTAPVDCLIVSDLAVVPGDESAILDFRFSGPPPDRIMLDRGAGEGAVRIVAESTGPGHMHAVVHSLRPGVEYRLTIAATHAWGGLREHWFRALTTAQAATHRKIGHELTTDTWLYPYFRTTLMRDDPDPLYVDVFRRKIAKDAPRDPGLVRLLASVLEKLRDQPGARLLVPDMRMLDRFPFNERWRTLVHLAEIGDTRAVEACRQMLLGGRLETDEPFVGLLHAVAGARQPSDLVTLTRRLEAGTLALDERTICALYWLDPVRAPLWLRAHRDLMRTWLLKLLAVTVDFGPRDVPLVASTAPAGCSADQLTAVARRLPQLGPAAAPLALSLLERMPRNIACQWAAGAVGATAAAPILRTTLTNLALPARVRESAALALGLLGDPLAADVLRVAVTDRQSTVARASAWALGKLRDKAAVQALIGHATRAGEHSGVSLWSLGSIASPAARSALRSVIEGLLGARGTVEETRMALAIWALARVGAAEDRPLFQRVLDRSPAPFVKRQAEKAMGRILIPPHQLEYFLFPFMLWDRPGLELWPEDELAVRTYGGWGYRSNSGGSGIFRRLDVRFPEDLETLGPAAMIGLQVCYPGVARSTHITPPCDRRREVLLTSHQNAVLGQEIPDRDWIGVAEVLLTRPQSRGI